MLCGEFSSSDQRSLTKINPSIWLTFCDVNSQVLHIRIQAFSVCSTLKVHPQGDFREYDKKNITFKKHTGVPSVVLKPSFRCSRLKHVQKWRWQGSAHLSIISEGSRTLTYSRSSFPRMEQLWENCLLSVLNLYMIDAKVNERCRQQVPQTKRLKPRDNHHWDHSLVNARAFPDEQNFHFVKHAAVESATLKPKPAINPLRRSAVKLKAAPKYTDVVCDTKKRTEQNRENKTKEFSPNLDEDFWLKW